MKTNALPKMISDMNFLAIFDDIHLTVTSPAPPNLLCTSHHSGAVLAGKLSGGHGPADKGEKGGLGGSPSKFF